MSDKISMELNDARAVSDLLNLFPDKVQLRARKTGLRKAALKFRTAIRRDAPKGPSGNLRKAIRVRTHRNGSVTIGLKERYYYKTLDFVYPSGGGFHPWFEDSVKRHAQGILGILMAETEKAIAKEAAKTATISRHQMKRSRIKGRL